MYRLMTINVNNKPLHGCKRYMHALSKQLCSYCLDCLYIMTSLAFSVPINCPQVSCFVNLVKTQ